jgi:hypothetical protein
VRITANHAKYTKKPSGANRVRVFCVFRGQLTTNGKVRVLLTSHHVSHFTSDHSGWGLRPPAGAGTKAQRIARRAPALRAQGFLSSHSFVAIFLRIRVRRKRIGAILSANDREQNHAAQKGRQRVIPVDLHRATKCFRMTGSMNRVPRHDKRSMHPAADQSRLPGDSAILLVPGNGEQADANDKENVRQDAQGIDRIPFFEEEISDASKVHAAFTFKLPAPGRFSACDAPAQLVL